LKLGVCRMRAEHLLALAVLVAVAGCDGGTKGEAALPV
jgi:hypothetical protein